MSQKRRKKITDVGKNMPSNFKFGLIVGVAILWTEFIKNVIFSIIENYSEGQSSVLASFIVAVLFTLLAYLILNFYVKIRERLKKIKI